MKKLLPILISLLMGTGITLVSLELFLRLNPKFGYSYSSFRFESEKIKYIKDGNYRFIRPSELLGYEHIPNGAYASIHINSHGLVGKEYKLKKGKGTYRILILGDSIAEQNWSCVYLESLLNKDHSLRTRYKFEIWNAGVGGYCIRQYALYLKNKGLNYKPDMVIIYFCLNDFGIGTNVYYKTKGGLTEYCFPVTQISKFYNVNKSLMRHSYLYRFIVLRLNNYLLGDKKIKGVSLLEHDGRFYTQMIKEICEKNKIPLLAVIFPYLIPLPKYSGPQAAEYKIMSKVMKDLKINYLDLHEYLPANNLYILRNTKEDYIHPDFDGHCLIGKIIYEYLAKNYFEPSRGDYLREARGSGHITLAR